MLTIYSGNHLSSIDTLANHEMASAKSRFNAPVLPLALHTSLFDLAKSESPKTNLQAPSQLRSVVPKAEQRTGVPSAPPRKMCMCSPSTHPGAFRCSLHKKRPTSSSSTNSELQMRRPAMKKSIVRIDNGGVVEWQWMKRAPTSPESGRRGSFHPQPSTLSRMTTVEDAAIS
ncbi:hypothetical protein SUGI_0505250 [Cryptomeria japonica]|nr:hypothetical protein SUGI_0505250 [Cryptomeria japonica]